jgi:hypothetical protein
MTTPRWRFVAVVVVVMACLSACGSDTGTDPDVRHEISERFLSCSGLGSLVLLAQTVPSATLIPCVTEYPPGWTLEGVPVVRTGFGSFSLSSDIAGRTAVTVTLTRNCVIGNATAQNDFGEPGTRRWFQFLRTPSPATGYDEVQFYRFEGGCATYRYTFQPGTPGTFISDVNSALTFVPRSEVAAFVRDAFDQTLCGPQPEDACVP